MAVNQQNVTNEGSDDSDRPPAWLKILVVVLGIAIVGMIILIAITAYNKVLAPDAGADGSGTAIERGEGASVRTEPAAFADAIEVKRPEGSELVATSVAGRELVLHFRAGDGSDIILIIDRTTGEQRRINVR